MLTMAMVMRKIVTVEMIIINWVTWRKMFERIIRASAKRRRGTNDVQNLLQTRRFISMGELIIIQKDLPSRLMAG